MLKPAFRAKWQGLFNQPPSGGCVLKLFYAAAASCFINQPPSGGCVLKLCLTRKATSRDCPAAFRRLCVETKSPIGLFTVSAPAAFRRLCVETCAFFLLKLLHDPAAFRRLCVETSFSYLLLLNSRPAAFRRLCVETWSERGCRLADCQPPSGGCVLKHVVLFKQP